ncbi:hypothetical protein IJG29_01300, partial [Candidatus Saccharibacteria bacterium]|nr:hypothetical protein [Candidatus Saccharibacteria bacterium]
MRKVIQNKLDKKTRRGLSLMLPLGLRSSGPSPRADAAHPRAAALRRPFGEAFSATRLMLPVSFLVVLSFLYINIYINTTLANSHAINDTDSYSFNLADTTNLSISLPAPETLTLTPSAEGVFGSKSIAVGVSTNSPYGYTLTMSAASSSLSRS